MWELRIRCSNWGWMCKKQNMLKNWTGEGGSGRGKIGICDAFVMHFGIFRNKLFRIIFRMVFLMHFSLLTGGVLGIFEKFGDIGSDIGLWCTY